MSDLRGSLNLLMGRWERKLGEAELKQLVDTFDMKGLVAKDILCYGQPAPEAIVASLSIHKEVFDKFSNRLFDLEHLRFKRFEVFPQGIPTIDELRVELEMIAN